MRGVWTLTQFHVSDPHEALQEVIDFSCCLDMPCRLRLNMKEQRNMFTHAVTFRHTHLPAALVDGHPHTHYTHLLYLHQFTQAQLVLLHTLLRYIKA